MIELMKRYEAQYGNSPWEEVLTDDFNLFVYDEFQRLERENTKLKALLTWRLVTQKPDVDGLYVVTKRDESSRWDKSYHLVRFKNGEWKLDLFSGGYVYSYFNVPIPAPEGETNDRVDETV